MSDYLWDGTGEPDAEVERLEALLANLRHTPRPLALPAEAAADVSPRARRTGLWRRFLPARLFEPVWLAASAALLVTFMLGAGALVGGRLTVDEDRAVSHDARPQAQASSNQEPTRARPESPSTPQGSLASVRGPESANVLAKVNGGVPVVQDVPRKRAGAPPAGFLKPRQRHIAAEPRAVERVAEPGTLEAMSSRGGEAAATLFDGTRMLAKEQLIFALRLTGAKLKEVQGKAHGAGDAKTPARGGVR